MMALDDIPCYLILERLRIQTSAMLEFPETQALHLFGCEAFTVMPNYHLCIAGPRKFAWIKGLNTVLGVYLPGACRSDKFFTVFSHL
jgi:hypothetical protein